MPVTSPLPERSLKTDAQRHLPRGSVLGPQPQEGSRGHRPPARVILTWEPADTGVGSAPPSGIRPSGKLLDGVSPTSLGSHGTP